MRTLIIIGQALAFIFCITMFVFFFAFNPLFALFFLLASIDQYEDVYRYLEHKELIPENLVLLDIIFELVLGVFAIFLLSLSVSYYLMFQTPFASFLFISSLFILYSSIKDIRIDILRLGGKYAKIPIRNYKFAK